VVTTKKLADQFANGMEYFNTFGGNTTSCAVGLSVLDELRDQRLQEHARVVGEHMLARLRELREKHSDVIADVRGRGLFLGLDLTDAFGKKSYNSDLAVRVSKELRERGILLTTEGPKNQVHKDI
jgi:ethanolamine-phosphate phospho-lyase